jgi:hypothetical protein
MSTTSPPTAAPTREAPTGLRIVLFGMPAAGKSSLLGALGQAAQLQEHVLQGRLVDVSQGLGELQSRVYSDRPQRTAEEIVPYPVRYEPFAGDDGPVQPKVDATLFDCDGRVANDLLVRGQGLRPDSPEGSLARQVLDADALLLALDVSAPTRQMDDDFDQFGRFLRLFERGRGQRTEIGGLPVFLVLTKCDLLAESRDSVAEWRERIDERKQEVEKRFRAFVDRGGNDIEPQAFGQIDLHLWATAVKRPPLQGASGKTNEPYGVAELFLQCLQAARDFQVRSRRSSRRLFWTVAGALAVMATLVLLAGYLVVSHLYAPPGDLQARVDSLALNSGQTPADRLKGTLPQLKQRRDELNSLTTDPHFPSLPKPTQQLVRDRLAELGEYTSYFERLQQTRAPINLKNERALDAGLDELRTKLTVPHADWTGTDAARFHDTRLAEAVALRKAVDQAQDWYESRRTEGEKLWVFADREPSDRGTSVNWTAWQQKVKDLLTRAKSPPAPESDPIPGAEGLTYAVAYRFDRINEARTAWLGTQEKLERVRDLAAALGLGGAVSDRPPVLVIPEPPGFSLKESGPRLKTLRDAYPRFDEQFTVAELPDAVRGDIRQAARTYYDRFLEPARAEVLQHLKQAEPGTEDTASRWTKIRDWLADPEELRSWRVLARVFVRIVEPERPEPDPVSALAVFLRKERIELTIKRLALDVPDELRLHPVDGANIYLRSPHGDGLTLAYDLGDKRRNGNRPVTRYQLTAKDEPPTPTSMTYRPGDTLWATVPLKSDGDKPEDWLFTWTRSRSLAFQFERLTRSPRLHRKGQPADEGKIAEGVSLVVTPENGIPALPDLVPVVVLSP